MDDEKFFKQIKGLNVYHAKRANKASTFEKQKQYDALDFNNRSANQSPFSNQRLIRMVMIIIINNDVNGNTLMMCATLKMNYHFFYSWFM